MAGFDLATAKPDDGGGFDLASATVVDDRPVVAQNLSPTLREGLKDVLSKERFPTAAKFLGGVGATMDEGALRLKQLFGNDLTAEDTARLRANQDLSAVSGGPGLAGQIAGGIAMTAAPGAALYRGATALAGKALPAILAPTVGGAASGGVIGGLTQPVMEGESAAGKVGIGMAGGALGDAVARTGARIAQPIMQSPAVRTLLDNDIVPTIGRAAGGFLKDAEAKLSSVPILGDIIKWGANRSAQELNLAAIKTVDPTATQIGREGIQAAQKAADDAYATVLSKFTITPDQRFSAATRRITNDASRLLTEDQRRAITEFVNTRIAQPSARSGTPMSGELFKEIDAELGAQASGYMRSMSQSEKNFGNALFRVQSAWRDLVERNAPKAVADELAEANRKWANLTILERAAAKGGTDSGTFNATQLQQAVRESDPTIRKRAFAAGNARGQELSDAAKSVLGGTYPDSGTAGRLLTTHALLGGAGALAGESSGYGGERGAMTALGIPLAAAALASPFYTRAGARYMMGDLAPGLQKSISEGLRGGAPYASQSAAITSLIQNDDERQQRPKPLPAGTVARVSR